MRHPVLTPLLVALPLAGSIACDGGASGAPGPPAPAISEFAAVPGTIVLGDAARLRAVFANGRGRIDPGIGPVTSGAEVPVSPTVTTTYTLSVVASAGRSTSRALTVQVNAPPSITEAPRSMTLVAGASGRLSVAATGSGVLSYQWLKDGTPVAGATLPELSLASVSPRDEGEYACAVSNRVDGTLATVTTPPARLRVNSPPVIDSQPASLVVMAGGSASLTVAARAAGALAYEWQHDGAAVAGATGPTLTIPSATAADAGVYRVVVSSLLDGTEATITSRDASLVVEPSTCRWVVARDEPLETAPAGAIATQGSWGLQGPVDAGGRRAWGQGADWNRLSFPVDLGATDVVGLEVELWVPPHDQPIGAAAENAWTLALEVLGASAAVTVPVRPSWPTFRWAGGRAIAIPDPAGGWHLLRVTGRRSSCALQAQLDGIAVDSFAGPCADGGVVSLASTSSNASCSAPGVAWSTVRVLSGDGGVCLGPSGPPTTVAAVSALDQRSGAGRAVDDPPGVIVHDASGWPVAGAVVDFRVTSGGGAVTGNPATTDAHGVARVGSWVVGPGGAQTLEARVANAPDLAVTFTATARDPSAGYDVALQYVKPASDALVRAVASARARIERMVVADVPDAPVSVGPMSWCANLSASWTVDDLHVAVVVETIDGANGILAQAGPCLLREGSHLPVFGLLRLDSADVALLESNGTLASVVLHELLHVVGFGTTWSSFGLVTGAGGADPVFTGPEATAAFVGVDGGSSYAGAVVPLENTGGAGTASSHWRESVFGRELMTGYVTGPANPVSHTTIASLADLGYVVDPSAADPFDIRTGLRALEAPASPITEELVRPARTVDAAGRLAPLAR